MRSSSVMCSRMATLTVRALFSFHVVRSLRWWTSTYYLQFQYISRRQSPPDSSPVKRGACFGCPSLRPGSSGRSQFAPCRCGNGRHRWWGLLCRMMRALLLRGAYEWVFFFFKQLPKKKDKNKRGKVLFRWIFWRGSSWKRSKEHDFRTFFLPQTVSIIVLVETIRTLFKEKLASRFLAGTIPCALHNGFHPNRNNAHLVITSKFHNRTLNDTP